MENLTESLLSKKVLEFEQHGVVKLEGPIFEGEKLAKLQRVCNKVADREFGAGGSGTFDRLAVSEPHIWEFIREKKIIDQVEALIGPDIAVSSCNLFAKRAHTPQYVQWHTDIHNYYTMKFMDKPFFVAVLIAVTDSTIENGCVKYISGSHKKHGRKYKNDPYKNCLFGDWQGYSGLEDYEVDLSQPIIPVELKAGWGSAHSAHTIHASDSNNTDQDRMLINIKYFPTHIKLDTANVLRRFGSIQNGVLVRGKDIGGTCIDPFGILG